MIKTILHLFIFISLTSFYVGEPIATLSCKSDSGKTHFSAKLPSCAYVETAEFSIDNSKYDFTPSDIHGIIFEPENSIFTIYLEAKDPDHKNDKFIRFWAIPETFKKVKSERGPGTQFHDTYEFRAKIYGTEPRKGFDINTKTIELICTLDIEL